MNNTLIYVRSSIIEIVDITGSVAAASMHWPDDAFHLIPGNYAGVLGRLRIEEVVKYNYPDKKGDHAFGAMNILPVKSRGIPIKKPERSSTSKFKTYILPIL